LEVEVKSYQQKQQQQQQQQGDKKLKTRREL
jgi:hypothetical protein